jgi:dihydroxyacetone kinase-like protein
MMLDARQVVAWLKRAAACIAENKEYLTELDAAIGDADHGINMDRGFQKVVERIGPAEPGDVAAVLKTAAMTLISSVGGAGGPLYGTLFLRASTAAAGKQGLDTADVAALFSAGLAGVAERGKAVPGDKTMIDALQPATQALQSAAQLGRSLKDALNDAVEAAKRGMESTIPLLARKGRASYLGERSIGHQDPGATSTYLILKSLLDSIG